MISAENVPEQRRALEHAAAVRARALAARLIHGWRDMGPQGFQDLHQAYVPTAVSVEPSGWAHFEYVKRPEYRWGIFLPISSTIAGLASVTSTGKMSGRKCRGSSEISCAGSS